MSTPAELRLRTRDTIKRSGAAFVLRRNPQNYDSMTSEVGGAPQREWSSWACDWQYSRAADGSMVITDDVRLLVAAEDLTDPKPGDIAEYVSTTYRVVKSDPVRKAGVSIAYDVNLERA